MDIASAFVGAIDLLLLSVVDATRRVTRFRLDLSRLNSILCSIKLAIDDLDNFNTILDRPQSETEMFTLRLLKGEKLVRKCSKVKWNIFKKWYYSHKLTKFEALLLNFFQIDVAAYQFREIKRMCVMITDLKQQINDMSQLMNRNNLVTGEVSLETVSDISVGFEQYHSCFEEDDIPLLDHGSV